MLEYRKLTGAHAMTKMMIVDKQFLADIYGISYEVDYDNTHQNHTIREVFSNPCREMYPTLEEAYASLVNDVKESDKDKIFNFEKLRNTWSGRIKMLKYSFGMLPAKNMKYLSNKLSDIEKCRNSQNIPSMNSVFKPLGDKFLISESFIRPSQKMYVFVKAHSIHFESAVYEADTYLVGVHTCSTTAGEPSRITMNVDIHSVKKEGQERQHFRIHWDDFSRFNDDYLTTDTTGQFIFSDKDKCLAFAREMLGKDIKKIQNNMNSLAL